MTLSDQKEYDILIYITTLLNNTKYSYSFNENIFTEEIYIKINHPVFNKIDILDDSFHNNYLQLHFKSDILYNKSKYINLDNPKFESIFYNMLGV